MSLPIEISNGQDTVKIYTGTTKGRPYYQISFYRAGRRERRTFSDKSEAKREAKVILGQLAIQGDETEEAITATDIESLIAARAALKGVSVPLHLAVEGFAGAVQKLGMPADPFAALHEAVAFYLKHHPIGSKRVKLGEMAQRYMDSRKRIGLSEARILSVKVAMKALKKKFSPENYDLPTGDEVVAWLEEKCTCPGTKNSYLKTLKAFAKWAVKEKLVAAQTITGVDYWKDIKGEIEIYTPEDLRSILSKIPKLAVPRVAIGAFAGMRASEIQRLDWSEINLERGFILVGALKAKTAARRLVPISKTLKAWLKPHAMESGPVVPLSESRINQLLRKKGLPRKRNALRHSYISYRLAQIKDTPRVALECGNSPAIIFKHYRELVAPKAAKEWFGIMPDQPASPAPTSAPEPAAARAPGSELKAA